MSYKIQSSNFFSRAAVLSHQLIRQCYPEHSNLNRFQFIVVYEVYKIVAILSIRHFKIYTAHFSETTESNLDIEINEWSKFDSHGCHNIGALCDQAIFYK